MANKFIGIKRLWYADPMAVVPTQAIVNSVLAAQPDASLVNLKEVKNVHQDTWGYQQGDPEVTDYINELTGKSYYRDKQDEGEKTINFTMGEYAYEDKAALQGGKVVNAVGHDVANLPDGDTDTTPAGWAAPTTPAFVNKTIIALTKTDTFVCFTNASIVGKGDQQQKAIGLGVVAVAMESETDGLSDEYWWNKVSNA